MLNWSKIVFIVVFIVLLSGLGLAGCPKYHVWQQEQTGKAELARASSNRMIAVQEAEAKLESASKLADAEIARARGVAEANKIIGDSLKGNEAYLRYLWIDSMHGNQNVQLVYIPTEANLPILEANRAPNVPRTAPAK